MEDLQFTICVDRILEALELESDKTVYEWIASKGFPKPLKFSSKCARWYVSEVNAWISEHAARRGPITIKPTRASKIPKKDREKVAA